MRWSRTITVVDAHAEGEIGRVVTGGVLPPPGQTLFDQREHLATKDDWLRKFLLNEPRGGGVHSANLIVPPVSPEADVGFIIMEKGGTPYPAMSGSNTICTAAVVLATGLVPMTEPETRFTMEAPGGLIRITARCRNGRCESIRFTNVPCFVFRLDQSIEVEGHGTLTVDVAYGGMWFALVDAGRLGFRLTPDEARDLVALGGRITKAAVQQVPTEHPENPKIRTISSTHFVAPLTIGADGRKIGRNVGVIQPGRIDRCPTGTATCARLAILHARGQIKPGEMFENRSIIDTRFEAEIVSTTSVAGIPAVVPSVAGRGFVTGIYQYGIDPADPFPEGFRL